MAIRQSIHRSIYNLGSKAIGAVTVVRDLWLLFIGAIAGVLRTMRRNDPSRRPGEIWRQMHSMGNRSHTSRVLDRVALAFWPLL